MNQFTIKGSIFKFVVDEIEARHNYQKTVLVLKCENGTRTIQHVPIDFPNEKSALLGGMEVGMNVEITCVPKGRMKVKNDRELYYAAYEAVAIEKT